MLEFRYNGCPECKSSCLKVLRACGYHPGRDFRVEYHDDHRSDKIYEVRPDYLKIFSGGIMYNPDTQEWFDFYDKEHLSMQLVATNKEEKDQIIALMRQLDGSESRSK